MAELRESVPADLPAILSVINDSASAYRGHVDPSLLREPYMSGDELEAEAASGVVFWVAEDGGRIAGVMGLQRTGGIHLIRHSYVGTADRGRGIGRALLTRLLALAGGPVLVGTWEAAAWAVGFYRAGGFTLLPREEGWALLSRYWTIPAGQARASVVLANPAWMAVRGGGGVPGPAGRMAP